jgi:hypothetical protein
VQYETEFLRLPNAGSKKNILNVQRENHPTFLRFQVCPETENGMHGLLTNSNLAICAFILILGLIAAAATFLDRSAMQPMRVAARSRDSEDGASPEPES